MIKSVRYIGLALISWIAFSICIRAYGEEVNVEKLLFDDTTMKLTEAVKQSGQRHAIYSYIVANAATPGFDFMGVLPADDRAVLARTIPEGEDVKSVVLEFVMARIGENTKRQSAYLLLMKKKMDILNKAISKGQR